MRVVDLGPIAHVAREFGLALLVDATFASPINFRPLEHGADVVITSATKYLNGHSDVIAGAVAGSASFVEEVNRLMRLWGQAIDPHAAWLVDRGMRTLARPHGAAQRQRARGRRVGRDASGHRAGALPRPARRTPITRTPRRCSTGSAAWSGSSSPAAPKAAERLLKRLKLVAHAPSLAGRRDAGLRAAAHLAQGISARGPRGARHSRRVPPAELRHRGRRGHHRGPGAGAGK